MNSDVRVMKMPSMARALSIPKLRRCQNICESKNTTEFYKTIDPFAKNENTDNVFVDKTRIKKHVRDNK